MADPTIQTALETSLAIGVPTLAVLTGMMIENFGVKQPRVGKVIGKA
jgi:hypothetical protein